MKTVAIMGDQRLIRTDVRRGLLAPDMLLTGSQGQAEGAIAVGVFRFSHQAVTGATGARTSPSPAAMIQSANGPP